MSLLLDSLLQESKEMSDFPFLILLGSNVTAAFEAQRHAEPRGPLVGARIATFDPFLNNILI